jgi:replicative DNA helicase
MYLDILSIMTVRANSDNYMRFVPRETVDKETWQLLQGFEEWYKVNPNAGEVDLNDFQGWFKLVAAPKLKAEELVLFDTLIDSLKTYIPTDTTVDIIKNFITRSAALQIFDLSGRIAEDGKGNFEDIEEIVNDVKRKTKASVLEDKIISVSPVELFTENSAVNGGLHWRLKELNISVGPIRKGNLILVSSRPEVGKTTFLASECTFMAPQKEGTIIWFNNEEAGTSVKKRIAYASLGITSREFADDPTDNWERYLEATSTDGKDNIIVYDKASHFKECEQIIKRYEPKLVIFDQLRKVQGFDKQASSPVDRLSKLYFWARDMAKEFCPVIVVHQADGTAHGQKWLEQNQLEGTKTEVQGELDVQIMIGIDPDPQYRQFRYINIVKNKLEASADTREEFRHGKFEVKIMPEIGRYQSCM